MSNTERCHKCNRFMFKDKDCNCKKFLIYYPEYYGDDKEEKYGTDFVSVMEQLAIDHNLDHDAINADVFEVPVQIEDENGIIKFFNVYAEPEINYYPKEVEPV